MNTGTLHRAVALLILTLVSAPSIAQDAADVLRGPDVRDETAHSLVQQSMTGGFQRIDGRPEAAALRLMALDPERMRLVDEAIADHALAVAMLLVDQIDLVRQMSDAIRADDPQSAQQAMRTLWTTFDPEHRRDPLMHRLASFLTPEEQAEAQRLLDEYWDAWISWELRNTHDMQPEALADARAKTQQRLALELFQQEVREGYELTLRRYQQALEGIYAAVEPTDEQRAQIRSLVIEHIRTTRLEATPEQRRAAMHRIYELLDTQRRQKLFDYLLRQVVPG
ncbi:MAG: hypothetical protein D6695_05565 [Planctomycetota bacterium]|nr:MAG: hypothetical protein D6695_05565 [Planctomycetota bacterium]